MEQRLWNHPGFIKLWIGQTISAVGSRITRDGLPLTAVIFLAATPGQMGVLVAISSLPVLLIGLLAGVWVDRLPRRPIMIAMDIGRLFVLLTIPAAVLLGRLSIELLYVVAAANSAMSLIFEIAYHALLPVLVEREHILEANSKLSATEALAEIGGPSLAGALIQLITAPLAILFDALSFLFSAASLSLIRVRELPPVPDAERQSVWCELKEGLIAVSANPIVRTLLIGMGLRSFFGNFFATLYSLYAIRELGLSPAILGIVIGGGGIGALFGTFLAGRLSRRFGVGRTLTGTLLFSAVINFSAPLAGGPIFLAAGMLFAGQILSDAAMVAFEINELSLRQTIVPDRLLGRVNATVGFIVQGISPIGALVAGVLASVLSARLTLLIAVVGIFIVALWTLASPLRQIKDFQV